ncbi:hypothetical protein JOB18_027832 [Solea senegalensis]|nr:cadherin-24-like [Solea senegalensis]KAG7514204.1 hypothetical protein JOB18_027832 [Solea senegalensis]
MQGQDFFSVDAQTGVLRTVVPDMDRETRDEYLVVLQAKDMGGHVGGLSGTTTVTVKLSDVNDNPPHFRRSAWSFSVSELAAPGVEVGRLTATDPDLGENAQLEFTILDAEEAEIFNITGRDQEGVIELNKLLDYETRSSYTFSVEVANPVVDSRFLRKGPFKDQATVRVMVLNADEPPQFSQKRYHLNVSENCPPVCAVGRVHAVDPDTGQSSLIRFSIDPQSDPQALFRISSDAGFISSVMELDREQEQWHNITVMATQRDNPNLVSRVVVAIETLDQNDNAPELDRQYSTSVCDSSAPGQVVQVLRAIDRDQGGQDSLIHFSVPPESSSGLNLTIRDTGATSSGATANLVLQSALEPVPGFSSSSLTLLVPVVLRDVASGLTNTGTVTLTVCPWSRNPQQRPGSAPLYGRLYYGVHALPVLADLAAGPLEAGVQLTQLTTGGISGPAHIVQSMLRSTGAEHTNTHTLTQRQENSDSANTAEVKERQEEVKTEPANGDNVSVAPSYADQSESLSNRLEPRPESSQTHISTSATSCTLDDVDTDSSSFFPSVSERSFPPVYLSRDTYSVVGSLNRGRGSGVNGGLYQAPSQLLSMCRLQKMDNNDMSRGWTPLRAGPAAATTSNPPRPLHMEDLLKIRLDQVTFDLSQPPYDSLQTYEFEGRDSRAESLSSLESEREKDEGREEGEGGGGGDMDELNQRFQRLMEVVRERERGKAGQGGGAKQATPSGTHTHMKDKDKEVQRWDF